MTDLIEQYRIMHADPEAAHFPGRSCLPYAWEINRMVREFRCRTLLDYGCGRGLQYSEERVQDWWGVMPTLYDPAVPEFAAKPSGPFDGVLCTDVLEHIFEDDLRATLTEIYGLARYAVFFSICCRAARRSLPNGMNCHVTIRREAWWRETLKRTLHDSFDPPRPKLTVRFTA